ncbi:hypothetical protein E2C01_058023 [Portunus trituberculatus]|uniref:Uncharacterized protein n=1 Tax=Portunus trituberculatus TaxID=210409 RepID=A0A5B7H227_PORTR|nr:hypothetical protein [Portunus trituberculatus]
MSRSLSLPITVGNRVLTMRIGGREKKVRLG